MRHYSKKTGGFYVDAVHGKSIPDDAVPVSEVDYANLMDSKNSGKEIKGDDFGYPIATEPVAAKIAELSRCTPAQGLVALFALKQITEEHVLEAISQIPDQVQQYTVRIGYQRATTWERGSPAMMAMAQLLKLSEEDLDELFSHAVTVQV